MQGRRGSTWNSPYQREDFDHYMQRMLTLRGILYELDGKLGVDPYAASNIITSSLKQYPEFKNELQDPELINAFHSGTLRSIVDFRQQDSIKPHDDAAIKLNNMYEQIKGKKGKITKEEYDQMIDLEQKENTHKNNYVLAREKVIYNIEEDYNRLPTKAGFIPDIRSYPHIDERDIDALYWKDLRPNITITPRKVTAVEYFNMFRSDPVGFLVNALRGTLADSIRKKTQVPSLEERQAETDRIEKEEQRQRLNRRIESLRRYLSVEPTNIRFQMSLYELEESQDADKNPLSPKDRFKFNPRGYSMSEPYNHYKDLADELDSQIITVTRKLDSEHNNIALQRGLKNLENQKAYVNTRIKRAEEVLKVIEEVELKNKPKDITPHTHHHRRIKMKIYNPLPDFLRYKWSERSTPQDALKHYQDTVTYLNEQIENSLRTSRDYPNLKSEDSEKSLNTLKEQYKYAKELVEHWQEEVRLQSEPNNRQQQPSDRLHLKNYRNIEIGSNNNFHQPDASVTGMHARFNSDRSQSRSAILNNKHSHSEDPRVGAARRAQLGRFEQDLLAEEEKPNARVTRLLQDIRDSHEQHRQGDKQHHERGPNNYQPYQPSIRDNNHNRQGYSVRGDVFNNSNKSQNFVRSSSLNWASRRSNSWSDDQSSGRESP